MIRKEIKKGRISLPCQKNTKKGILADALVLPQLRGGGLHFHVMLCGRGLGTTHIHRPLMAYVLGAKVQTFFETSKFSSSESRKKFTFRESDIEKRCGKPAGFHILAYFKQIKESVSISQDSCPRVRSTRSSRRCPGPRSATRTCSAASTSRSRDRTTARCA